MAKLYFKYGAMGSSKSAQALITKFNYEEKGMRVWLIKPSVDTRDGADLIRSRIGLEAHAQIITPEQDIAAEYRKIGAYDVIISDATRPSSSPPRRSTSCAPLSTRRTSPCSASGCAPISSRASSPARSG